jgi:hypothetical protein
LPEHGVKSLEVVLVGEIHQPCEFRPDLAGGLGVQRSFVGGSSSRGAAETARTMAATDNVLCMSLLRERPSFSRIRIIRLAGICNYTKVEKAVDEGVGTKFGEPYVIVSVCRRDGFRHIHRRRQRGRGLRVDQRCVAPLQNQATAHS